MRAALTASGVDERHGVGRYTGIRGEASLTCPLSVVVVAAIPRYSLLERYSHRSGDGSRPSWALEPPTG